MSDVNQGILRRIWEQVASRARNRAAEATGLRPDDIEYATDVLATPARNALGVGKMVGRQATLGIPNMVGMAVEAGAKASRPAYRAVGNMLQNPDLAGRLVPEELAPTARSMGGALSALGMAPSTSLQDMTDEELERRVSEGYSQLGIPEREPELIPSHEAYDPGRAGRIQAALLGVSDQAGEPEGLPDDYAHSPEGYMERLNAASSSGQALRVHDQPMSPERVEAELEINEARGLSPATRDYMKRGTYREGFVPSRGGGLGDAAWRAKMRGQTGGFSPSAMPPNVANMSPEQYNAEYRMQSPAIQRLMDQEWEQVQTLRAEQAALEAQANRDKATLAAAARDEALAEAARREAANRYMSPKEWAESQAAADEFLLSQPEAQAFIEGKVEAYISAWAKEGKVPPESEIAAIRQAAAQEYLHGKVLEGTVPPGKYERMRQSDPTMVGNILRGSGTFGGL